VIRIVVVDDHMMVRAGLAQLLSTVPDIELVGVATDGNEALDVIFRERPDVVLMDLSMPNLDGVEATGLISAQFPECKVLVLTSFSDQRRITEAFAAGANGYLLKHTEPDQIVAAIRAIHGGDSPLDPKAARVMLNARRVHTVADDLSTRQLEVLGYVRDGLPNKVIADRLGITERTVKAHLTRIFHHIGVSDRTQAAVWATRNLSTN
jgi:DNA-binding NarL/FixJ family response regulator